MLFRAYPFGYLSLWVAAFIVFELFYNSVDSQPVET